MLDKEEPDHVDEIFPGINRIMELFPDGPPSQEMANLYNPANRMVAALASHESRKQQALEAVQDAANAEATWAYGRPTKPKTTPAEASDDHYRTVDNDRQYYVTMPTGTHIRGDRRSRNHWSLSVISPPSPNGKTIRITENVPGNKGDFYIRVGEVANDILLLRKTLMNEIVKQQGREWEDLPKHLKPLIGILISPDESPFNEMYESLNVEVAPEKWHFSLKVKEALNTEGRDLVILTALAVHELWKHLADDRFEEDLEMAKNNGGMIWWELTGGRTSLNKVINSLTHNRHHVVLDNKDRIYLKVQNSEGRFVEGLVGRHNCRARLVDEPEYGETLCGKFHRQPELHSHRCNACQRVKSNAEKAKAKEAVPMEQSEQSTETKVAEAAAIQRTKESIKLEVAYPSTTSPDGVFSSGLGSTLPLNPIIPPPFVNEQQEWAAKNGPVITIQGPQPRQSNDIEGLAIEYRRVSDELMERASYYATLAEKYEALLLPTDAVKEAEAALEAVRAKDREDREAQIKALQEMLAAGPPA